MYDDRALHPMVVMVPHQLVDRHFLRRVLAAASHRVAVERPEDMAMRIAGLGRQPEDRLAGGVFAIDEWHSDS